MPQNYNFDYNTSDLKERLSDASGFDYNKSSLSKRVSDASGFDYNKDSLNERIANAEGFEYNKKTSDGRLVKENSEYFEYKKELLMGHKKILKGAKKKWTQQEEREKRSQDLLWTDSWIKIDFPQGSYFSYLPAIPENISDDTSSNWTAQAVIGSSAPVQVFNGTNSRTLKLNFSLHRELASKHFPTKNVVQLIDKCLAMMRKAVYPGLLSGGGYSPAIVKIRIQEFLVHHAICKSISYNWKLPIVDNKYQVCDVSMDLEVLWDSGTDGEKAINITDPKNPW